eukprot:TRINITY_DN70595_c0_g1_i1.p1 TRINITY_DN70595_c0_g1~~TRINITY_DN70595_c0_g1_i1.p1  ORF type:complete len:1246 (+),score=134.19 TRINITY_DN70595_c0_g1_i1:220-3738(+)
MAAINEIINMTRPGSRFDYQRGSVRIWNPAVASLTLEAFGSSAPSVLLALVEMWRSDWYGGKLGPFTILGSAAWNVFVTPAICQWAAPACEVKRTKAVHMVALTVVGSLMMYSWQLFVVEIYSPDVIEISEAWVTIALYSALLWAAYLADQGFFSGTFMKYLPSRQNRVKHSNSAAEIAAPWEEDMYDDQGPRGSMRSTVSERSAGRASIRVGEDGCNRQPASYASTAPVSYAARRSVAMMELSRGRRKSYVEDGTDKSQRNHRMKHACSAHGCCRRRQKTTGSQTRLCKIDRHVYDCKAAPVLHHTISNLIFLPCQLHMPLFRAQGEKKVRIPVFRRLGPEGSDEQISCRYRTLHRQDAGDSIGSFYVASPTGSALKISAAVASEGDYLPTAGTLVWEPYQETADIELTLPAVDEDRRDPRQFLLILEGASSNAEIDQPEEQLSGDPAEGPSGRMACVVTVLDAKDESIDSALERKLGTFLLNHPVLVQGESWCEQIVNSFGIYARGDEQHTVLQDFLLLITMPWRIVFAICAPPATYGEGVPCFICCLCLLLLLSVGVLDLAQLLACSLNVDDSIIAFTLLALGTSLPDAYAQFYTALEEEWADTVVLNMTGSVMLKMGLGIGLPWLMAALHWHWLRSGADVAEWRARYPDIALRYRRGAVVVDGVAFGFSALCFLAAATTCAALALLRRAFAGGELGGTRCSRVLISGFLMILWAAYVALTVWQLHTGTQISEDTMDWLFSVVNLGMTVVLVSICVGLRRVSKAYADAEGEEQLRIRQEEEDKQFLSSNRRSNMHSGAVTIDTADDQARSRGSPMLQSAHPRSRASLKRLQNEQSPMSPRCVPVCSTAPFTAEDGEATARGDAMLEAANPRSRKSLRRLEQEQEQAPMQKSGSAGGYQGGPMLQASNPRSRASLQRLRQQETGNDGPASEGGSGEKSWGEGRHMASMLQAPNPRSRASLQRLRSNEDALLPGEDLLLSRARSEGDAASVSGSDATPPVLLGKASERAAKTTSRKAAAEARSTSEFEGSTATMEQSERVKQRHGTNHWPARNPDANAADDEIHVYVADDSPRRQQSPGQRGIVRLEQDRRAKSHDPQRRGRASMVQAPDPRSRLSLQRSRQSPLDARRSSTSGEFTKSERRTQTIADREARSRRSQGSLRRESDSSIATE